MVKKKQPHCFFITPNAKNLFFNIYFFKAGINSIRENWNLNYSAAFVTCSLVNRTSKVHLGCPHTVSIIHPMDRSVRPDMSPNIMETQNKELWLVEVLNVIKNSVLFKVKIVVVERAPNQNTKT